MRSASASTPARSGRVSLRAGSTVSSIRFADFFRRQIPVGKTVDDEERRPGRALEASFPMRRDLRTYLRWHQVLTLTERHHVGVVLRQQADGAAGAGRRRHVRHVDVDLGSEPLAQLPQADGRVGGRVAAGDLL